MYIDGFKVTCSGIRVSNGKHKPLKTLCRDCTLYTKSAGNPITPTWRAQGFTTKNKYKCKIKELFGRPDIIDDKMEEQQLNKFTFRNSKVVIVEFLGKPVGWFECISDAARRFGHTTSTITSRIKANIEIEGTRFRYPAEGESTESFPCLSPPKNYRKPGRPPKIKEEHEKYIEEDVELDRKYAIVPYEVKFGRICVTRCTVMEQPQPLIGSAECAKCTHFKGRNKKTHEVACSNKLRKTIGQGQQPT